MEHDVDPKQVLKEQIGNIDSFEIYNNQILIAGLAIICWRLY